MQIPNVLPELQMGIGSLLAHKLRTLLTMLGMIFGVGAVVAMLSITEGARQEMIRYIDLLGVNNIVVEALEACLLYTSPSPRDGLLSRMPSSA